MYDLCRSTLNLARMAIECSMFQEAAEHYRRASKTLWEMKAFRHLDSSVDRSVLQAFASLFIQTVAALHPVISLTDECIKQQGHKQLVFPAVYLICDSCRASWWANLFVSKRSRLVKSGPRFVRLLKIIEGGAPSA